MADIEKLDKIIELIEQHPEAHHQSTWGVRYSEQERALRVAYNQPVSACGTAFCVAGWAGVVDKAELTWRKQPEGHENLVLINDRSPYDYGIRSLDLTFSQANELFSSSNSLESIKAMRDVLAEDPHATALHMSQTAWKGRNDG